ncbi:phage head closure protein [uncultured Nitratireductor sp.]|uniref:phage head closure protein n=1 Tax=uncultured Nitratireductor sp. TaxID=520953 RepID=UPI0026287220|nr:phage head closure protein [uncultured Nitratireductor sp.]
MTAAGDLRESVTFQRRVMVSDPYGNERGEWQDEFTCPARIKFLRGNETVVAARLQGQKVVAITIRAQPDAQGVTPAWRAYDTRKGLIDNDPQTPARVFDLKVVEVDERAAWVNILAEE